MQIRIPWRRRDARTARQGDHRASTPRRNQRLPICCGSISDREFGWLLFEPPTAPGDYHVYYMPFRNEGSWYFPTAKYLPPTESAKPAWLAEARTHAARLQRGKASAMPTATAVKFEAINEFHRFDPMEVIATAEEMKHCSPAIAEQPYLLFPEDRRYPIRMTDDLPAPGYKARPSKSFAATALSRRILCVSGRCLCLTAKTGSDWMSNRRPDVSRRRG